ncbi:MAG: PEP-CTERM sorting domain-containing protein [Candidatus Brocadiaceae bacterium]|nr:PEP-CTERM sorting domain-containing protein [Candidatus Brocadiaceae bacterium]
MKKVIVLVVLMVMGYSIQAQGGLITIGTATYSGIGYNLIWDDDNNGNSVVWLDYTSTEYYDWQNQTAWAAGLGSQLTINLNPGYTITWDDDEWRLPTTLDGQWVLSHDGTTPWGYNITSSEMGHLYYTELGNVGAWGTTGNPQGGYGLINTEGFQNLNSSIYWSGTERASKTTSAYCFDFSLGSQISFPKDWDFSGRLRNDGSAIAIRSGNVAAVPEPGTVTLMGLGMVGMVFYGIRRRRQRW